MKRWLQRVTVVVVASVTCFVAAELLARKLVPAFDPSLQMRLEVHGTLVLGPPNSRARLAKNTGDYDVEVRFGPRGFRDPRDVGQAGPEDVLVVGDSFAFGWGVREHERFSNRLEALTGRRCFNIAIPGQDLGGYARQLRHARQLGARARRLVIELSMETDLGPPEPVAVAGRERPVAGPTRNEPERIAALKPWLAERLALYGLATAAVHQSSALEAIAIRLGLVRGNLDAAGAPIVTGQQLEGVVDRVVAMARGYDASVLIVPSRGLWLRPERDDEQRQHAALVRALRARGLRVADPRAAFEATGRPLAMHFAKDGHWNATGHAVAARVLAAQ